MRLSRGSIGVFIASSFLVAFRAALALAIVSRRALEDLDPFEVSLLFENSCALLSDAIEVLDEILDVVDAGEVELDDSAEEGFRRTEVEGPRLEVPGSAWRSSAGFWPNEEGDLRVLPDKFRLFPGAADDMVPPPPPLLSGPGLTCAIPPFAIDSLGRPWNKLTDRLFVAEKVASDDRCDDAMPLAEGERCSEELADACRGVATR